MTQLVPWILAQLDESLPSTQNKIIAVLGQDSFMLIKSLAQVFVRIAILSLRLYSAN